MSSDMQIEEGEWEMTAQMQVEGAPEKMPAMPPMTSRQCISKDMMIPTQQHRNQDCKEIKQSISGDTATWSMRCTTHGVVSKMYGTSTYNGKTMEGTMQVISQGMKITSQVTGKRVGSCK